MTHYAWLQPTLERIADLLKMPHSHNSYGTPKVDVLVVMGAVRFLVEHIPYDAVTPVVAPTKLGGLLFEWSGPVSAYKVEFAPDPTAFNGVVVTGAYKEDSAVTLTEAILFADRAMKDIRKELAAAQH